MWTNDCGRAYAHLNARSLCSEQNQKINLRDLIGEKERGTFWWDCSERWKRTASFCSDQSERSDLWKRMQPKWSWSLVSWTMLKSPKVSDVGAKVNALWPITSRVQFDCHFLWFSLVGSEKWPLLFVVCLLWLTYSPCSLVLSLPSRVVAKPLVCHWILILSSCCYCSAV